MGVRELYYAGASQCNSWSHLFEKLGLSGSRHHTMGLSVLSSVRSWGTQMVWA